MVVAMATLLKRSDAPLYRIFLGLDWESFAQQLACEQCFEVHAVLHAPCAASNAEAKVADAIQCLGANLKRNGWFQAALDQAVSVLVAALPHIEEDDEPCHAAPAPKRRRRATLPTSAALAEEGIAHGTDDLTECASTDAPQSGASADSMPEEGAVADPLWTYVAPCTTREATKSTEVRAALEELCGKDIARSLLANTKATVAQDASGKKNRVLKLDGSLIKLK